jgi:thiol-disulfide isomerase/thioredoxin
LSFHTIEKRFFVNAALSLALVVTGCRCSDDSPSPASRGPESRQNENDQADPEGAEMPDPDPDPGEGFEPPQAAAPAAPEPAGTLEVVTAEALVAKLKASGRKGTLVNAWASFCGPCKREIPMLEGIAQKLRPRGVDVVLVSVDEPADRAKAEAFLKERNVGLTSYLAARPLGPFKQAMNPRWPGMLPASFLFDREGTLRYYWGGEAFENEVLPILEAFVAGKPLQGESTPAVAPENAQ